MSILHSLQNSIFNTTIFRRLLLKRIVYRDSDNNVFLNGPVFAAPVKTVNIEHSGEVLICSSGAIYPKPELRWSLSKTPLPLTNNTVLQNKQQLYSITGTLPLLHRDSHKEYYICTVSTPYSWRRATFTLLCKSKSS